MENNDYISDWAVMDFGQDEPIEEPTSDDNYNFE